MPDLRKRQPKRPVSPDPTSDSDFSDSELSEAPGPRRPPRKIVKSTLGYDESGLFDALDELPNSGIIGRSWHPREDDALLAAVAKYGSSWKAVAAALAPLGTKRTTAMCRNRHQRIRAPMQAGKEGKNKCKKCGQIKRGHTCTAKDVVAAAPETALARRPAIAMPRKPPMTAPTVPSFPQPTEPTPRGLLPEQPLLPPASGNAFHVDVQSFLKEVARRTQHAAVVSFAAAPPQPAVEENSDEDERVLGSLAAGVSLGALGALGAPGGAPNSYLASAAPPPIAPPRGLSLRSLGARSLGSLGNISFGGVSVISDDAEMVDLSDLQSAADAAIALRSQNNSEANLQPQPSDEGTTGGALTPPLPDEEDNNDPQTSVTRPPPNPNTHTPGKAPAKAPYPVGAAPMLPHAFDKLLPIPQPSAFFEMPHVPVPLESVGPLGLTRATAGGSECSGAASSISSVAPSGAPALMPLPSWSRAPSFSFADARPAEKPLALAAPPPRFPVA